MSALAVGLQEWAVTCQQLLAGRLVLAVRKGGIHERGGGLFALEHGRFALLPTYLHQDPSRVLPAHAAALAAASIDPSPGAIVISGWAEAARIWKIADLDRVGALGDELLWTGAELASRFAYRDQPWLHVIALRAYRLVRPQTIADDPGYAGCRSWIPLKQAVDTAGSSPALGEEAFSARVAAIADVLQRPIPDDAAAPPAGAP